MLDFYEQRRVKQLLYSKLSLLVLAGVAIFLGFQVFGVWEKERITQERRAESAASLAELTEREEVLTTEIERLSTPRGVEEEIRQKFDVVHEGEEVIVLVDAPEPQVSDGVEKKGFFHWIRNIF